MEKRYTHKETGSEATVKSGDAILADVAIMGAKRGCGWKYVWYTAKLGTKSGYVYSHDCTHGMYPNKVNYAYSKDIEEEYAAKGIVVVSGRPHQGKNAPIVTA